MGDHNYNHNSECIYDALGLTEDQYDELLFKTMQIIKRHSDGALSMAIEAAADWATKKFSDPTQRTIACLMMGQIMEKSRIAQGIEDGMLHTLKDLVKGDIEGGSVQFDSHKNQKLFMQELNQLLDEFNGELKEVPGGFMAVQQVHQKREQTNSSQSYKIRNFYATSAYKVK